MGLLSYISDFKDMDRLNQLMDTYRENEQKHLYLWSDKETDNFVAVIGVEIGDEVIIRQLAVNPSFRNEGIAHQVLDQLQQIFPNKNMIGTLEMNSIVAHWENANYQANNSNDGKID